MYSADRDEVLLHVVVGFVMEDFDTKEKAFPDVVRATNQMATATALHRDIILVFISTVTRVYIQSSTIHQHVALNKLQSFSQAMPNALIKGASFRFV